MGSSVTRGARCYEAGGALVPFWIKVGQGGAVQGSQEAPEQYLSQRKPQMSFF